MLRSSLVLFCLTLFSLAAAAASAPEAKPRLVVQLGPGSSVTQTAFSPDGAYLGAAGENAVQLWDRHTGELHAVLPGGGPFRFSPDGRLVAACVHHVRAALTLSADVVLSDPGTGMPVRTLSNPGSEVASLDFSPDGKLLAAGCSDHAVRLWDVETGAARPMPGASGPAHAGAEAAAADPILEVRFSRDGKELIYADRTQAVYRDLASGTARRTVSLILKDRGAKKERGVDNEVRSVAASPDGEALAITAGPGGARLLAEGTAAPLWLPAPDGDSSALVYSDRGDYLVTATPHLEASAGVVAIWNGKTRESIWRLARSRQEVSAPSCSADGKTAAWFEMPKDDVGHGKLVEYNVAAGAAVHAYSGAELRPFAAAAATAGLPLVTAYEPGKLAVWGKAGLGKVLPARIGLFRSLAVSGDGRTAACTGTNGRFELWDLQSGQSRLSLNWDLATIPVAAFSPDGNLCVVSFDLTEGDPNRHQASPEITLIDLATTKGLRVIRAENSKRGVSPMFSADSKTLVLWSQDGWIERWDVATGARVALRRLRLEKESVLYPSSDGRFAAVARADGPHRTGLELWDPASGKRLWGTEAANTGVTDAAFSPDGSQLAVADEGGQIELLDPLTGKVLRSWDPGGGAATALRFTPDGRTLLAAGTDYAVRVCDVALGSTRATLRLLPGPLLAGEVGPAWLISTPEGFYAGSPGVERSLRWLAKGMLRPADAYSAEYRRPELPSEVLTSPIGLPKR